MPGRLTELLFSPPPMLPRSCSRPDDEGDGTARGSSRIRRRGWRGPSSPWLSSSGIPSIGSKRDARLIIVGGRAPGGGRAGRWAEEESRPCAACCGEVVRCCVYAFDSCLLVGDRSGSACMDGKEVADERAFACAAAAAVTIGTSGKDGGVEVYTELSRAKLEGGGGESVRHGARRKM